MLKFVPYLVVHSKGEGIIVDCGFLKTGYGEQKNLFSGGGSLFVIASNSQSAEFHFTSSLSEQESSPMKGDSIQQADYLLPSSIDLDGCGLRIYETEIPSDSELIPIDPAIDPLIDADPPALRQ